MPENRSTLTRAREGVEDTAVIPMAPAREGGWHRYRRSCSTLLMKLGVPQPIRASVLTHAPGSRMTDEYDQVVQADTDESMAKLAAAFEAAAAREA